MDAEVRGGGKKANVHERSSKDVVVILGLRLGAVRTGSRRPQRGRCSEGNEHSLGESSCNGTSSNI